MSSIIVQSEECKNTRVLMISTSLTKMKKKDKIEDVTDETIAPELDEWITAIYHDDKDNEDSQRQKQ